MHPILSDSLFLSIELCVQSVACNIGAGGYEERPSKFKRPLFLRKVKLKSHFNEGAQSFGFCFYKHRGSRDRILHRHADRFKECDFVV